MKNKAFTLVELLGVIVILALISLVAIPPIVNRVKTTKNTLSEATKTLIITTADLYVDENSNEYPKLTGNVFCISLQKLSDEGKLSKDLKDVMTNKPINLDRYVKVTVDNGYYSYDVVDTCSEVQAVALPLMEVANVGDYVDYKPGNWNATVDNVKLTPIDYYDGGFSIYNEATYSAVISKNSGVACDSSDSTSNSGYRVLYKDITNNVIALVHAGISECYRLESDDDFSLISDSIAAGKYVNNYATSAHYFNGEDFNKVLGKTLDECDGVSSTACGSENDLIAIGNDYIINTAHNGEYSYSFVDNTVSSGAYGLRPVIILKQNIVKLSGNGTSENPYIIDAP